MIPVCVSFGAGYASDLNAGGAILRNSRLRRITKLPGSCTQRAATGICFLLLLSASLAAQTLPGPSDEHAAGHEQNGVPPLPPAPRFTTFNFAIAYVPGETPRLSDRLQEWLGASLQKDFDEFSCKSLDDSAVPQTGEGLRAELLDDAGISEIPVREPGVHLYVVSVNKGCMCGATGNCSLRIVEEDDGGIHLVAHVFGWGYYARSRPRARYPDVFTASHMSAFETDIEGYGYALGQWRKLYCGKLTSHDNWETEKEDVEACR